MTVGEIIQEILRGEVRSSRAYRLERDALLQGDGELRPLLEETQRELDKLLAMNQSPSQNLQEILPLLEHNLETLARLSTQLQEKVRQSSED